jgi:hypothetical protein
MWSNARNTETPYLRPSGQAKPQGTLMECGLEMTEEAKAIL